MGPYWVVDTINNWVYVVEDIVTAKRRSIHVQCMRLYADAAFKVTADTRVQAAYDDQNFVEDLVDWREDDKGNLQIRVKWLGFSANEGSLEPVSVLHYMKTSRNWLMHSCAAPRTSACWRPHCWNRGTA